MRTFSLAIPQNKETPITYAYIGKFYFRFTYARSKESQEANNNGQDFLWLGANEERFVFVLCDGVSQSFLGDLAARLLGENLGSWLLEQELDFETKIFEDSLRNKLLSLASEVTPLIESHRIPENLPPLVINALEDMRAHRGSASNFLAGVIDTNRQKAFIAWMGDSLLQVWKPDASLIEVPDGTFNASEGWSTRRGPVGEVHVRILDTTELAHLVAYSDGLYLLNEFLLHESSISHDSLKALISDISLQPASDDISFLELWCMDEVAEFDKSSAIPFVNISDLYTEKKTRKHGQSRILLSYESNDRDKAREVYHTLRRDGFDVWMDNERLLSGQDWSSEISRSVHDADVILVLLSKTRVFDNRRFAKEIRFVLDYASEKPKGTLRIIPVRLEECEIPFSLRHFLYVDLFIGTGYVSLIKSLEIAEKMQVVGERGLPSPMASPPFLRPPSPAAPMPRISRIFVSLLLRMLQFILVCYAAYLGVRLILSIAGSSGTGPSVAVSPWITNGVKFLAGVGAAILFTLIPFWSMKLTKYRNRVSQAITEIALFMLTLSVIAFFMFRLKGDGLWIIYSIAIAAVLDGGGHILDYMREERLDRIKREIRSKQLQLEKTKRNKKQTKALQEDIIHYATMHSYANKFDALFGQERLIYLSIPIGVIAGVALGIYYDATSMGYIEYSIQIISILMVFLLAFFIYKAVSEMITPVYTGSQKRDGIMIFTSLELKKMEDDKERDLGFAKTTTDLRELYRYDAFHNTLLLCVFLYIFLASIKITYPWLIVAFAVLLLLTLFSQVPFFLGQKQLHKQVLMRYAASAQAAMEADLEKDEYAPFFRKPDIFTAFSLGTGGLLLTIAINFIQDFFK